MSNNRFETDAIRIQVAQTEEKEHSNPVFFTSSFTFEDAEEMRATFAGEKDRNIYSRFTNPNAEELVRKVCTMEGAPFGYAHATGMASVYATFAALLNAGDHLLSCRSIFGSTHTLFTKIFPKWNIETTYLDVADMDTWDDAVKPSSKVFYLESPTNPALEVIDLELVADFCRKHNLIFIVDNCFATPYLQRPMEFGAQLVIHSATKYMDGQGRVMGGIVVGEKELIEEIYTFSRSTGPAISPFNAWTISKSLETLAVRMDRHCDNALQIAQRLEKEEKVEYVLYPFLPSHPNYAIAKKQMKAGGGMLSFNVKGGIVAGRNFLNALQMCSLTANLGDTRTIATHPASTTHAKLTEEERNEVGISPGLIRISVGLEHVEDIWEDIIQALQKI